MMITFDLSSNYMTFLQQVRDWARDPSRISHGSSYVLPFPPKELKNSEYCDIELKAGGHTTTVKIRRHDLYIIGYKMEKKTNWLEFKWKDLPGVKFIPNSISLGFSENYSDLGGLDGLLEVGYKTLEDAIISLAKEEKISGGTKDALRVISVMVSEATRFKKLSDVFVPAVQHKKNVKFVKPWMPELINNWGTLSNLLLQEDAYGVGFHLPKNNDGSLNKLTTIKELNIRTAADAANCVAVLSGKYPIEKVAIQVVVEVMLLNGAGKDPANIYGNIVGRYIDYNYSPFDKLGKDNVKVKPGEAIPLSRYVINVPTKNGSLPTNSLILEGNLWNYNSPTSSDEIAKGIVEFSPQWNGKVSKDMKGKFGLVRVIVTWNGKINV